MPMKNGSTIAVCALAAVMYSSPAAACRYFNFQPFFHDTAPPAEAGNFAAEVEIVREIPVQFWTTPPGEQNARPFDAVSLEARVLRPIRGASQVEYVEISPPVLVSSCWGYGKPGDTGILVGKILSHEEDGTIIVDLVRGPSLGERWATQR